MTRSERDELKRAITRFQELTQPHRLMELLKLVDDLERGKEKDFIKGGTNDFQEKSTRDS